MNTHFAYTILLSSYLKFYFFASESKTTSRNNPYTIIYVRVRNQTLYCNGENIMFSLVEDKYIGTLKRDHTQ